MNNPTSPNDLSSPLGPPIDDAEAEALKASVAATWAAKSGAWTRWADYMAELAVYFNTPLLDAAAIASGQRVLDLASGVGEPSLDIARRVAPDGSVTATDLVPEMLATARQRATDAGLANIDFKIADMEALPFADAAFDRVTCRFGLMFSPRVVAALGQALRVLKPGGRAGFLVWGPIEDNTMFAVVQSVIPAFVEKPPFNAHLTPFRFAAEGDLAAAMTAAGFTDVVESERRFEPQPPAGVQFWRQNLEMSLGTICDGLAADRRAALDAAIERAFEPYRDVDGYRLAAQIRIGTGVAPD